MPAAMSIPIEEPKPLLEIAPIQETTITEVTSEADAKAFIFMKESSNRLDALNSIGCKGLGQDCNGQLHIECPNWQTDRPCQEGFWQSYMERRYGSWAKAKDFWLARVPINGQDVGNWW